MSVFFSFFHSMKPSFIMYLDVYELEPCVVCGFVGVISPVLSCV